MRDITNKSTTLRTAKAQAIVLCDAATIELIREKKIPKGDVLEYARAAGYLGAKQTPNLIPHCHPVRIDSFQFDFEFLTKENYKQFVSEKSFRSGIVITGEAKCVDRTGIEMEALTGVSIVALTLYDTLKPLDSHLEISGIRLLEKTGGKSDKKYFTETPTCAVLVCSDFTHQGKRKDESGKLAQQLLEQYQAKIVDYKIVPDKKAAIQKQIRAWVKKDVHFIFTTGGTGFGPHDCTVEAVKPLLDTEADGVVEAMRAYGQQRTPFAMMSRAIAGTIKQTTVVTLPGSVNGVRECLNAILPAVFHARAILLGGGH
ncbi:MAG TPA: bifunctional molybdenum cofactor biosynthesis protein MoaC/MoaB [Bacteroidota bacterium]|nr:bifunctional molybdenum cofactor biosynthesis protein MoaC/MoaB [Bacteroidota bacterium]